MFSHVMVGADDVEAARKFYDATLGALGYKPGRVDEKGRVTYASPTGLFMISRPIDGAPARHANGGTIGFACPSPEAVKAWHEAGIANGGITCENPPGIRNSPFGDLYLAYLRDPAGNKLCGAHRLPRD